MTNQPLAEIKAPWIAGDISVSDIESSHWLSANPIAITRQWSGEIAPSERHAEVRSLWTEQALYVRFVCRQTEALIVSANPQLDRKTIGLWNRDVCEIFIAPEPNTPARYFEFEAAPTGEWVDLAINFKGSVRETDFEFQSGMTEELTIAMRIPWSNVIPKPERGVRWRANLFRCVGAGNERYLAWQPTHTEEPNFHVPEVFGWLRFV
jgi:alpha-galactosidase